MAALAYATRIRLIDEEEEEEVPVEEPVPVPARLAPPAAPATTHTVRAT
jgi:hypothetical protein